MRISLKSFKKTILKKQKKEFLSWYYKKNNFLDRCIAEDLKKLRLEIGTLREFSTLKDQV